MSIKNVLLFVSGLVVGFVGSYKITNCLQELNERKNLNNGEGIKDEYRDKITKYFEYKETSGSDSDSDRESSDEHESIQDEYRLAKEEVYDSVDDASKDVEGDSVLQVVDQLEYAFDRFADCVSLGRFKLLPYSVALGQFKLPPYSDAIDNGVRQTSDPLLMRLRFDGKNWYWQYYCYPELLCLSENVRDELSNSSVEGLMMAIENVDENRKWAVAEYDDNYGYTVHVVIERDNAI